MSLGAARQLTFVSASGLIALAALGLGSIDPGLGAAQLYCRGTDTPVGKLAGRRPTSFAMSLQIDRETLRWCAGACRRRDRAQRVAGGDYALKRLRVGWVLEDLTVSSDLQTLWGRLGEEQPQGFTGSLTRAYCTIAPSRRLAPSSGGGPTEDRN